MEGCGELSLANIVQYGNGSSRGHETGQSAAT